MTAKNSIDGEVFDMYLGLPGQGKTLTLNEYVALPALLSGEKVYSTYWINWNQPNYQYFRNFEEIDNVRNCVVIFDEVGDIMNPREWDSENGNVRNFFMLHRHRYVDIYASTQHISLIAKTALIQVDRFFMCEKSGFTNFLRFFYKKCPYLFIKVHQMALNDIKLLDMPVYSENEDEKQFKSIETESQIINTNKLVHNELDKYKVELIHGYCPVCRHRQGKQILKHQTPDYAVKNKEGVWELLPQASLGHCPKHKTQKLEVRATGMYDSHYEPEYREQDIVFKAFVKTEKLAPFKGALSPKNIEIRNNLKVSN